MRDQWYLDEPRFVAPAIPSVSDQWLYQEEPPSTAAYAVAPAAPPVRDQWYMASGSPNLNLFDDNADRARARAAEWRR